MEAKSRDAAEVGVDGGEVGDAGREGGGDVEGVVGAEAVAGRWISIPGAEAIGANELWLNVVCGGQPVPGLGVLDAEELGDDDASAVAHQLVAIVAAGAMVRYL